MTTDKRKQQLRLSQQESRQKKKDAGLIQWVVWVKPEWKEKILGLINSLKNKDTK